MAGAERTRIRPTEWDVQSRCGYQDPFLLEAINTFVVDTQLWQGCHGQLLQSQCPQPKLLLPEQSVSAGFPTYSCPDQVAHGERHHRKLP